MKKQEVVKFTNCYEIVMSTDYFFYMFIGGRGIGKTYSMLKESFLDNKTILYLRRTDQILQNTCTPLTNPYKAININEGSNVQIEPSKGINLIVNVEDDEHKEVVGYATALSTFGNLRGADFSDVDLIVFDEWINISPINPLKNEALLLFNLIETVNRNKELLGLEAPKVVLLSNANTIDDDIIRNLNLADKIQELKQTNGHVYTDTERGVYLELLNNKEVHDLKLKTSLYKLTQGTTFYEMALENEFTKDYFGDVGKIDYKELKPLCAFNSFFFYEHKSKDMMYVSYRKADCPRFDDHTIKSFKRLYGFKIMWFMESGLCLYMNYNVKLGVKDIFK